MRRWRCKKGRTKYALGQGLGGLTTSDQFAEFLTLPGYEELD
jgi:hypothetical protein